MSALEHRRARVDSSDLARGKSDGPAHFSAAQCRAVLPAALAVESVSEGRIWIRNATTSTDHAAVKRLPLDRR
jgi:hypothetical protein